MDHKLLLKHIDHVAKVAGPDHVGLGSDFDGISGMTPMGMEDVSQYPVIGQRTDRDGLFRRDIRKIMGSDILRLMRATEDIAKEQGGGKSKMRSARFCGHGRGCAAGSSAIRKKKRIACLSSTYHVRSHSDNFITRFLEGYWIHESYYEPPFQVASLWMDQVHPADIGAHGSPTTRDGAKKEIQSPMRSR